MPGYLNFAEGQERVAVAAQAFDDARWQRLATVKQDDDPTDVFRNGIRFGVSVP